MPPSFLIFALVLVPAALFLVYLVVRVRYKKAGPDEALIVFGRRKLFGKKVRTDKGEIEGFRIIRGGGTFVWPAWEQYEILSLRMMTLEIDLRHVYTVQGIPINVKAVAQVKVQGDVQHIRSAAEGFLGMPVEHVQATIKETVAGHLRGIIGTLTVEELYRDQRRFQEKVRDEAHTDLEGMGFEFRSFVFQAIQDDEGYLNALGQPKIQEALKNARIATAAADRDAAIEEEQARQQKEQKRIGVDTEIAEADKALSLKTASIKKEVDVADAQAVKAGEMELKVQDIRIADQEVQRQKLELNASIREKADAKKYEAERLADAKKYTVEQEAAAERMRREQAALALKAEGIAKAEAESVQRRQIGLAEAEAIQAKGEAEAEARRKLAEALKLYNEAGLSIEALKVLPEIAAAVSEPLSRAGETTIISHGGRPGDGTGAARLTDDVIQVITQLGPIMKQLSGVDMDKLLRDVSSLPAAVAKGLGGDQAEAGRPAKDRAGKVFDG
ncbi:MAG: SPFH domain-containing protein [Thermoanaerobaculales bacterium]|nr:SPFH domain-containing protein [Thermoanaerobaculales bacterium]